MPVGKRQVGRNMLHLRIHHGPQNAQQQRDRERQERKQKAHREDAQRDPDPTRPVRTTFRHASKLHHPSGGSNQCEKRAPSTAVKPSLTSALMAGRKPRPFKGSSKAKGVMDSALTARMKRLRKKALRA